MDVHLLVYDLSQGLARQMSMGLLGFQLDAVYHTSVEVGGREYVYDGGIVAIAPGSSHLGPPLERLRLGTTRLPMGVIDEYLDSLRPMFTAEAYDLFHHNCNNFSDTLANFLVGRGIPEHIANMPQAVLASPMAQMLLPQIARGMNPGSRPDGAVLRPPPAGGQAPGTVAAAASASSSASSSSSSAPSGHPHAALRLPTLARLDATRPVLYPKVPPLDKLVGKLGDATAARPEVQALRQYLEARGDAGAGAAALPDLRSLARFVQDAVATTPRAALFPVVDLFRCSLADPRVSGYFAAEAGPAATVARVLACVDGGGGGGDTDAAAAPPCPYALRLVTLQAACNLFSTPLFADALLGDAAALRARVVALVASSFLDESHTSVRVAAAALLFNVARADRQARCAGAGAGRPALSAEDQVELAASVVEAIAQEDASAEALTGMLSALGHLVYGTPGDGDLADLLRALDAEGTVRAKKAAFPDEPLVDEVGAELLGKGLQRA